MISLSLLDKLRPFLSRIIAAPIAAGCAVLLHKTGIAVDDTTVTAAVVAGVYGVAHKVLDKVANPADTASAHLAAQGKSERAAIAP